jgi:hypothetical protein
VCSRKWEAVSETTCDAVALVILSRDISKSRLAGGSGGTLIAVAVAMAGAARHTLE